MLLFMQAALPAQEQVANKVEFVDNDIKCIPNELCL